MSILTVAFFLVIIASLIGSSYAAAESYDVVIPKGAGNPSFDPQFKKDLLSDQWYLPTKLVISLNDTVRWTNQDQEKHSVTSGESTGRAGISGERGKPDGKFDSGLFGMDESWSYTFAEYGTFPYFCSIHPWMYGIVVVQGTPDYPQDGEGNRVTLPVMTISSDRKYHNGLYWDPPVLKTGEQVLFTLDFFDKTGVNKLHYVTYDFVIIQNGKVIHQSNGFSENGSDLKYFVFTEPGPVKIRFENIGGDKFSISEFSTIVYEGDSEAQADAIISKNKGEPYIYQGSLWLILAAPGILAIGVIWTLKKKR
ncbi:MAG: plastocyanin/azurin family copper-binding protein [Candidatus Nitrosotenuis sp.]